MSNAVKKTISLPPDMAKEVEEAASSEGMSVSAVIQKALRLAKKERLKREFGGMRGYWSSMAKKKGILSEKDLEKYLEKR